MAIYKLFQILEGGCQQFILHSDESGGKFAKKWLNFMPFPLLFNMVQKAGILPKGLMKAKFCSFEYPSCRRHNRADLNKQQEGSKF